MQISGRYAETPGDLSWYPSAGTFTVLRVPSEDDTYLLRLGRTGQRIRKRLLNENQTQVATRAGVDHNTISRWENGHTSLSAFDLVRWWTALGKPPAEWFLDPTDSMAELDLRIAKLRQVAAEEAQRAAGEATGRPSSNGTGPRPRKRSEDKPPRSPQ